MIDYEKLLKELNEYATYILSSLKTKYSHFLSTKREKLLIEMMKDENFVVIDGLSGDNKVHINPSHVIFKTGDYNLIKEYIKENVLIGEILKFFITFYLSEEDTINLDQANLHQKCRIALRDGFISFISQEFCTSNRLVVPEMRRSINLDFIHALEDTFGIGGFGSLKSLAFSKEYLFFCEKFYEQTGENILDFYQEFLEANEVEFLDIEEDNLAKSGR